jgi:FixJ family two-component response regulator
MAMILIVDDQPVNREFLATLLGYFAHKVLEAADGGEALETIRLHRPDLVIVDVLMPTMDGYEFLLRLREEAAIAHTPVVFYTAANYEPEARAIAEAAGVLHFLTKPAEPLVILDAINSVLGTASQGVSAASLNKFNRRVVPPPADPIDPAAIVFIVDDDPVFRQSLISIVNDASLQSRAYATAEEFLENYESTQSGCLVLDLRLPGMSGIKLLELLRSRRIQVPAIILTGHGDIPAAVDAMRLRVLDFLEKPADRRIFLAKIYRALQEDAIYRREQAKLNDSHRRIDSLTARERELVKLLILGKSSKEIAVELHISVKTVAHHREHVMAKTQASNLADLVRLSMIAFGSR